MIVAFRRLKWPSWVKYGIGFGIPILLAIAILGSNAVLERLQQRHLEDVRAVLARDALYALLRSPGWLLVASQVEGRVGFLTAELTRENPSQSRDVLAGMVRELQAVTDWPNATLNKLGVPE